MQTRLEDADRLRHKRVNRARYEAELQRRYMSVDPAYCLVADTLEADWNQKLRALAEAQEECERQQRADRDAIGEQQREALMALSRDFQRVWENPNTPDRERKRIVRLLLEDVTLVRREQISAHIRFRGGRCRVYGCGKRTAVTQSLTSPLPQSAAQLRKTKPAVIAEIDRLLNTNTQRESAVILNKKGFRSGGQAVRPLNRRAASLSLQSQRSLLETPGGGVITMEEIGSKLDVLPCTVKTWRD